MSGPYKLREGEVGVTFHIDTVGRGDDLYSIILGRCEEGVVPPMYDPVVIQTDDFNQAQALLEALVPGSSKHLK